MFKARFKQEFQTSRHFTVKSKQLYKDFFCDIYGKSKFSMHTWAMGKQ